MNISKVDSTNFRATMNVSQMTSYKHYWQEVANDFAKKTAEIDATVSILNPSGIMGFAVTYLKNDISNKKESMAYISCTKDSFENMTNESPVNTAEKLTKVFSLLTEANDKKVDIISKFKEKVKKLGVKASEHDKWHSLYVKEVEAKKDKVMFNVNNKINNTNDLRGFEIFI